MKLKHLRKIIREEFLKEVLMSPAMFRNVTLNSPLDSHAVKDAVEKLAVNLVRSRLAPEQSVAKKPMDNKYVREAFAQLETGFKNSLANNFIRQHGKEFYDDTSRELDDAFYELVENVDNQAVDWALSRINEEMNNVWSDQSTDMKQLVTSTENSFKETLENAWNVGHTRFEKELPNIQRKGAVNAA